MSEPTTDAGIGAALGDAGPCPTITYGKKVWTVGHPTQKAKAWLELLVIEIAQDNIDKSKPILKRGVYEKKCDALDMQISGGHHKTGGALWSTVNSGPDGQVLFLTSLLRERHPEVTIDDVRGMVLNEPRQVRRAMLVTVPGFFTILVSGLPMAPEDRPAKAAELTADFLAGLTPDESINNVPSESTSN